MPDHHSAALAQAQALIDESWEILSRLPFPGRESGQPFERLPDLSHAAVCARSARAKILLARLDALTPGVLPGDVATTVALARTVAQRWAREGDWYWLVFDPLGIGFFGMFAPTAYCGGAMLNILASRFGALPFASESDVDRYLGLLGDFGRLIGQLHARTQGQAERGIRMPKVQLDQAIPLLGHLERAAHAALMTSPARLAAVDAERVSRRITDRLEAEVVPAFTAFRALLADPAYRTAAPDAVGIAQYPGGAAIYAELVRQHTTLDLNPADVHAAGLKRMAEVREDMRRLLDGIGFAGEPGDYLAAIERDPAWRAAGTEAIAGFFQRYIDRIGPDLDRVFAFRPVARHGVSPLPEALSASMTFGYYDQPNATNPTGRYLFNASHLSCNALANIAALNYHELVPGHHFHLASQKENETLAPFRKYSFVNAFNEGWAEYAATLAGELGMYEAPEEQFGRYMVDALFTCRLVVDTGMNALGWSLERARDYLRDNGFMPQPEVESESIRYSCDIPAQSLAYKLGDAFLLELREGMRAALGPGFDIRDFHDAVLKPGALPLPLVAANVASATETIRAEGRR